MDVALSEGLFTLSANWLDNAESTGGYVEGERSMVSRTEVTPEGVFLRRRELLKGLAAAALIGCRESPNETTRAALRAPLNDAYRVSRPITPARVTGRYNNFYELSPDKERAHELASHLRIDPWSVRVEGLVDQARTFDLDDLRALQIEERILRFRCVEAWAMVVPWIGFPLRALLERVQPKSNAHFVRFWSVDDDTLPGVQSQPWYPWPYFEALRLDEAMHDLCFVAIGMYGHELERQHGAPVRLVVPWKYGFKSIKSIARIELVGQKPPTFWSRLEPREYGFYANVDPDHPHPRWSQAHHRMLGTGHRVPTLPYNGYDEVASLYPRGPSHKA